MDMPSYMMGIIAANTAANCHGPMTDTDIIVISILGVISVGIIIYMIWELR